MCLVGFGGNLLGKKMASSGLAERLLPNPKKNVPYLDAIRGVAVAFILIRHAWGISGQPDYTILGHSLSPFIMMMSSGVDLFFVLSGVLLASRFIRADADGRASPDYREYMKARILRIGPPYWVVLGLVLLLFTPTMIPNDRIWSVHGAFMALAHATFTQSLFIVSYGAYMVDAPFWTLTVEMVFYALLPFAVRVFYKFRWWQGVVLAFAISLAWLYLCRYSMDGLVQFIRVHTFGLAYSDAGVRYFLACQILGYLPHFAIGCAISVILQYNPKNMFTSDFAGIIYFLAGLFVMAMAMSFFGRLSIVNNFTNPEHLLSDSSKAATYYVFFATSSFAVAYGLIILGASLGPQKLRDMLSAVPGLSLLGVLGYSVYLIHMPIYYTLDRHAVIANLTNSSDHFLGLLVLGSSLVMLLSYALFVAIERPAMVWSSNVRRGSPSG